MSEKLEGRDLDSKGVSVEENSVINDPSANETTTENLIDPAHASGASGDGSRVLGNTETSDMKPDPGLDNKENQTDCIRTNDSADEEDIKPAAPDIEGSVQEPVTEEEGEYNVNDLVWGKVSGHPWWPGQIFEPSAASRKAMKHFKKDGFLIAYFGDHTFAWNDVSRIKPFRMYFNQMEKQSHTESFRNALDCALDEVSRRVEFGLSCRCVPKEVQDKFKSQNVDNRGIRKESCQRDGSDNFSTSASFSPALLIRNLKSLATTQFGGVDRLGFVVARAQLLAFNRHKGYDELPAMEECGELLENDGEDAVPERVPSGKEKEMETTTKSSSVKRRRRSGNDECMGNKVKSMSGSGKNGTVLETGKQKASDPLSGEIKVKRTKKLNKPLETGNNQSILPKKILGIGERIQRAAIHLGGSTPVLKPATEFPPLQDMLLKLSLAAKDPMNGYSVLVPFSRFFCDFRNSNSSENAELYDPEEQVLSEPETQDEEDTPAGQSEVVVTVNTNTEKQEDNMVMQPESEDLSGRVDEKQTGKTDMEPESEDLSGVADEKAEECTPNMESESEDPKAKECTQKVESESEGGKAEECPQNKESEDPSGIADEKAKECTPNMEPESEDPSGIADGKDEEEYTPTALILNFQDSESVPLGADLNKIFSHFGPLDESQTEGLGNTKRAKVVFRRRSDAETAFSSAEKHSTFGPSLISYRLHYGS